MPQASDFGYFEIMMRGKEGDYPALPDVSSFLYDFNLLYEFSRIIVDPRYDGYKFTRFSTYRNNRRLVSDDRLEIERLSLESPIELVTVLAALPVVAAALWVVVQTIEKIANFSINRDILKLQREKLKGEIDAAQRPGTRTRIPESEAEFADQLRTREADYYFGRVVSHLRDNSVQVAEIEITHLRELRGRRRSEKQREQ